jgi:DNA-binding transcriptional MerR regulator
MTIQEMSEKAGVTCHTLRFWERELEGLIVPLRTKGGQRRYTSDHLAIIQEIKRFKTQGLSLPDIKAALKNPANPITSSNSGPEIDLLADRINQVVRSTIYSFFEGKLFR